MFSPSLSLKKIVYTFAYCYAALFCVQSPSVYSARALYDIIALSYDQVLVPNNGVGIKQYRVTNNSKRTKVLVVSPVDGVVQHVGNPGECSFPFTLGYNQSCILTLQLVGEKLKQSGTLAAPIVCSALSDNRPNPNSCYRSVTTMPYKIYYPLSIYGIPDQGATANVAFNLNIHDYIANYDNNVNDGAKPTIGMSVVNGSPTFSELGLSYDPQTLTLSGVPNQTGVFEYQLSASNSYSTAAPKIFRINIAENPKDKPHFRTNRLLPAAIPSKSFHYNLMQLLEPQEGFNVTNQVTFKIDEQKTDASIVDWLSIEDSTELVGTPKGLPGETITAFIYAESNTGGQSETVDIELPIAYDEAMKPQIQKGISVSSHAGGQIYFDMRSKINDPSSGDKLKVIIDAITFAGINWLKVSKNEPTILEGTVPLDATGQQYSIKLHANNSVGGDSDQEIIQLKVETDPARKPRFKAANPVLHELHPGQPYLYDFKYYNDVFPEYKDAPYTITFAEGYEHPSWLKLENNQLIAKKVDENIDDDVRIYVVITNIPGGSSEVIPLNIYFMG